MIFDTGIWSRIFIIFTIEITLIIFCLVLAIKTLRKGKDHATLSLFFFYILMSSSFIINLVYLPLQSSKLIEIFYRVALFLNLYSLTFLIIFLLFLYRGKIWFSPIKQLSIAISYLILIMTMVSLPNTIIIDENANFKPRFPWQYAFLLYIVLTLVYLIPISYLLVRMYLKIKNIQLKKNWKSLTLGIILMFFLIYGLILYNTWDNEIYHLIWMIFSFGTIPFLFLIYYGIGYNIG